MRGKLIVIEGTDCSGKETQTNMLMDKLKADGYVIISVEQTEDSTMLDKLELRLNEKYAFVFGNEVKGVGQEVVNMSDIVVEIPQTGTKHSLNVSVSIGIVLWEIARLLKEI